MANEERSNKVEGLCPWCKRGKTEANGTATITIKTQCPNCGRFYTLDLGTRRTGKARASPRK